MRFVLALALVLGLCPSPSSAETANERRAAVLVKEAERLYLDGKYRASAELLKMANELDPDPRLTFNIARAYDQAGDLAAALDFYRAFLSAPGDTDAQLTKRANLALDRLRALLARDETNRKAQELERRRLEETARSAQKQAASEVRRAAEQREEYEARERAAALAKERSTNARLSLAYASGGAAVLGLATGIGFGVLSAGSKQAFGTAATVADKERLQGETQTRALIADVGYALAVAGAVGAVLLFPREPTAEHGSVSVTAALTLTGAAVTVSF